MYNGKLKNEETDRLFEAILSLESMDECYRFFEDLCTVPEVRALSQRFAVAALLRKGETYTAIAEKTGASTATISRVNRSVAYGSDGYEVIFNRLENGAE